ncbi:MFS transporter [Luteimonas wenzhouensis]|jgi:MFS family permease|uniref:Lysosomal dipeptide transporter MFSD1 n=1 Tax=Luteimonas wenzhouensis TaxID=2599615 RepID=A0A5C5U170_9GAMM|nr:MFS transporter [Luteimonas wenzhouensis]NLW97143.1 major facilitator superfamily domain-containing protein 1 [Xanthomonadaceae bacterium]TWT19704.1 major facilitator superfamily domain-containing protein 1 [Luteimonas wenzhouensis]
MTDPVPRALPRPSPAQRWLALVLVSVAMFGNYYVYDAFGPVVDLLREQEGFTYDQISMVFSAYSVAAVVVLLIGGYVIDRWGTKRSIALFAAICLAAAALMASTARFETMLAGRFLLGIGAEPLIVAATAALAKWFKGKELSFAFGINLSIARLGSASADWSTSFASGLYANWQDPLWLATGVATVGLTAAMLYWMVEARLEGRVDLGEAAATDRLELKGMYAFSASYWYIVGLCVVFYSTVFPFRAFAIDYFQQAHGLARETAGMLSSLLPVAAIIVTPLFGLWVDRVGRRSLFMAIGSLAMLPLFLLVTYAPPGPDIPMPFTDGTRVPLTLLVVMLMLGGVFSLIPAVMWPAVAYIVRESRLGSAYSMMTLCQQVGVALVPLVVGRFNTAFGAGPEHPAGYAPGMWFYTALAALGLLFSYLLWRAESGPAAHGLEYPSGEKPA